MKSRLCFAALMQFVRNIYYKSYSYRLLFAYQYGSDLEEALTENNWNKISQTHEWIAVYDSVAFLHTLHACHDLPFHLART